jgi:proteic killer suppression protein
MLYTVAVIKSFRHKGLELFFRTGRKSGIQPHHAERIRLILGAIDDASGPEDLDSPRLGLHKLSGDLVGFWAVKISGNWRVIFRFEREDVAAVDYLDYH